MDKDMLLKNELPKSVENNKITPIQKLPLTPQHQKWLDLLATIILPIETKPNSTSILVEGLHIPKGFLLPEIAQQIIDPKSARLKIDKHHGHHKISYATYKHHNQIINLFFKELPIASGREYLTQLLYDELVGSGCAHNELVKLTINNLSYPVLIIEALSGKPVHQFIKSGIPTIHAKHLSLHYLASLFECQEDGKSEHYFVTTPLTDKNNTTHHLTKIDLNHAFMPPLVKVQNTVKLQQKVILYALDDWLDQLMHPEVITEWLALDKKQLFEKLLTQLSQRDKFYYHLFNLDNLEQVKKYHHKSNPILIESILPTALIDLWIQLSERIDCLFKKINNNKQPLTHRQFLNQVIPLTFGFYQAGLKKHPNNPLKAFKHIVKNGYIFSDYRKMYTKVAGVDLLLSSLNFIPNSEDIQQRKIKAETLITRLYELQNKQELLLQAKYQLKAMKADLLITLPNNWCEEIMDDLMDNEFPQLEDVQQKFIIDNLCKVALQRLRIEHMKLLDNKLLIKYLKQLPYLLHLRIVNCPHLSTIKRNHFMRNIIQNVPHLRTLELKDIPQYEPNSLLNILRSNTISMRIVKYIYKLRLL